MVSQHAFSVGCRWPAVLLAIVALSAAILWWQLRDPGTAARYRLDAAAVRALPADAAGDERLLKHLGSLMRDDGGAPWQDLGGPQRTVVVALCGEQMVPRMGLANYIATMQQGQAVPTLDEIAAAYDELGCREAADVIGDIRALLAAHAWPPGAAQVGLLEQRLRAAFVVAATARRAFVVTHAEDIANGR